LGRSLLLISSLRWFCLRKLDNHPRTCLSSKGDVLCLPNNFDYGNTFDFYCCVLNVICNYFDSNVSGIQCIRYKRTLCDSRTLLPWRSSLGSTEFELIPRNFPFVKTSLLGNVWRYSSLSFDARSWCNVWLQTCPIIRCWDTSFDIQWG
jgi:hypothetical protein